MAIITSITTMRTQANCTAESSQCLHSQSKICSFQAQAIISTNLVSMRKQTTGTQNSTGLILMCVSTVNL